MRTSTLFLSSLGAYLYLFSGNLLSQTLTYYPPDAYRVSSAVYAGTAESLSLSGVSANPSGMTFSAAGSQLFISDDASVRLYLYNLSPPFDVSTAVYAGIGQSLDLSTSSNEPHEAIFNLDGSRLFVLERDLDEVQEYNLTVNYDLSTATFAGLAESVDISGEETFARGMDFNTDGTKLYVLGGNDDAIVEYNLSVGYDVSTAMHAGLAEEFSVLSEDNVTHQLVFNFDGSQVFVAGNDNDAIIPYTLGTPYDISTASFDGTPATLAIGTQETDIRSLDFNTNGTKVYIVGRTTDRVHEYSIDPGNYPENVANDGSIDNSNPLVITLDGETFQDTDNDDLLDINTEVIIHNVPDGLSPVLSLSEGDTRLTLSFSGNAIAHNNIHSIENLTFTFTDAAFTGASAAVVANSGSVTRFDSQVGIQFLTSPSLQYIVPNAFDVSKASWDGISQEFSYTAQSNGADGVTFNPQGTKMLLTDINPDELFSYSLSTPFDLSTAVYDGVSIALDANGNDFAQETIFNEDGTKMYVAFNLGDQIEEYTLSTPYDISSATYAGALEELNVSGQEAFLTSISFGDNGNKFFVVGAGGNAVVEYTLGSPFDISSASYAGLAEEFSVAGQETNPDGLLFNYDGSKMYITGSVSRRAHVYSLASSFDVSTASYDGLSASLDVGVQELAPRSQSFNPDGTRFFLTGISGDAVVSYTIDPGNYPENPANDGSLDNSHPLIILLDDDVFQDSDNDNLLDIGTEVVIGNVPAGLSPVLTLSNGDTQATLTFTGNASNHDLEDAIENLTFSFTNLAFASGDASLVSNAGASTVYSSQVGIYFLQNPQLVYYAPNSFDINKATHFVSSGDLPISTEMDFAQGLEFRPDGLKLFVVNNDMDKVVSYSLTSPFDLSTASFDGPAQEINLSGIEDSPTGMTLSADGTKLCIVGMAQDIIYEYNLSTPYELASAAFAGTNEVLNIASEDSDMRGIRFTPDGLRLVSVGKDNALAFEYNLSTPFDISTATYAGALEDFDISGEITSPEDVLFNPEGTVMWVLAPNSDFIASYTLSTPYDISSASYAGDASGLSTLEEETTPRGMAFNPEGTQLFLVGTTADAVYNYRIDPGDYLENPANDGSLDNSKPLEMVLTGGATFQDLDADDLLDISTEVTINNIPSGLTPVISLLDGDTRLRLTFTGNATNHNLNDAIDDLTIVFDNSAFTGGNAGDFDNSGSITPYSTQVGIAFLENPKLTYFPPNAYDVGKANYAGTSEEFPLIGQTNAPEGINFRPDGLRMYVCDNANARIVSYRLSTPYDVSTATFLGDEESILIPLIDDEPRSVVFNVDGTNLFLIGGANNRLFVFSLNTPYKLSTAVFFGNTQSIDVTALDVAPRTVRFSADGSRGFVLGRTSTQIYEYSLGVPFDISSATFAGFAETFSVGTEEPNPESFRFDREGNRLYCIGDNDEIFTYSLSNPFDISTASFEGLSKSFTRQNQESIATELEFNDQGNQLFITGEGDNSIVQYTIDPGDYLENTANDGSINNSDPLKLSLQGETFQDVDNDDLLDVGSEVTINNVPAGLTPVMSLSNGDTEVSLSFTGNATEHDLSNSIDNLSFIFNNSAFVGGDASSISNSGSGLAYSSNVGIAFLENPLLVYYPPNAYDVGMAVHTGMGEEFSVAARVVDSEGLHFRPDGLKMYVSHEGEIIETYNLTSPYDVSTATFAGVSETYTNAYEFIPREIVFNSDGSQMYIAHSASNFIAEYTLSTPYQVATATYTGVPDDLSVGAQEASLRGHTFNQDGSKLYVTGVNQDSIFAYELSLPFDVSTASYAGERLYLGNEEDGPQDLIFKPDGTEVYVVGDDSEFILKYLLATPFDVSSGTFAGFSQSLDTGNEDTEMRGMAFNRNGTRLLILGDDTEEVVEYDIENGDYPENSNNDGGIDNSRPLVIRLFHGETFQDLDNDDLLDVGSEVSIQNVPAGLTPVLSLSQGDTEVTLTFSGTATNNADADDVADLPFSFSNLAFTGNDANLVTNSGFGSSFSPDVGIDFRDIGLPITLLSFIATLTDAQTVNLAWETVTEIDNASFEVQRSNDAHNWDSLTEIAGAGSTAEPQSYRYIDQEPLPGTSYYRLRQVDFDGSFSLSPIRSVHLEVQAPPLWVYPNPSTQLVYVESGAEDLQDFWIWNILGQDVKGETRWQARQGGQGILDIAQLPKGTYLLQVGNAYHRLVRQ